MIDPSTYTWLKIDPVDAWFFRDGRPSNRGEDQSDIASEFPPNASTVVGAVRAALARANGWNKGPSWSGQSELTQVLGDGFDNLGPLSFLGPFLMESDSPNGTSHLLFPMPRHVVGYTVDGRFVPVALLEPSHEPVTTDRGSIRLPVLPPGWQDRAAGIDGLTNQQRNKPPEPRPDLFLTSNGLTRILRGEVPDRADIRHRSDLYRHESRVGILRDADSRTTGQNAMYSPRYVRLRPGVSLIEGVFGVPDDWSWPTVMPLGGESRMATVERLASAPRLPSADPGPTSLAVALSPARCTPDWWGAGPDEAASKLGDHLTGQVTCVALDRPRLIGGWSFRSGPRPLSPCVPPGTVWWLSDSTTGAGLTQVGMNTAYGFGLVALSSSSDT